MDSPDAAAGVGASLDLGEVSLSAILGMQASVNSLAKVFSDWKDEETEYQYGAVDQPILASGIAVGTATLVFDLAGPSQDLMWEVRRLAVSYPDPSTGSQAGTAYIFASATRPSATPLNAGNWVDWTGGGGATLPSVAFYSTRQIVLHAPERLWCVVVSPASNQQYVVSGRALEYPDRRYRLRTDS